MKILITVDPEIPVPPKLYGGIERIVSSLCKTYSEKGHEVFLLANPESTENNVKKIIGWHGLHSRRKIDILKNAIQLYCTANKYDIDIIHSFSRLLYLYPIFLMKKTPVLQTYQRKISTKSTRLANLIAGNKINFSACSRYMFNGFKKIEKWTAIYNFADTNYFIPDENVEKKHLIFLGRIEEIKGTKEAIEVAIATNSKLIIAGNIQNGHEDYFNTYIKPFLDNPLIEYVGPVDDEQKKNYLQNAKAFLFPIKWDEPFGIVMAEAMACGVPVIGFNRGSVTEVVKHGKTGFIVSNVEEMINAVNQIGSIDRNLVRSDCVSRFSLEMISKQYLELFGQILNTKSN
jgi:glycosyltransferase involved in cell wall biosynthesis